MPDGLAAFIAERLDEAETAAKAASPGPWFSWIEGRDHRGGDSFIQTAGNYDMTVNYQVREYGPEGIAQWQADQDYIAANDPARELRAITAKRAILADCTAKLRYPANVPLYNLAVRTLRSLGTEWAGHPAYLPAWAPQPGTAPRPESSPATIPPVMPRLTPT